METRAIHEVSSLVETNVSALYVSLFVEGPAVEFLDGDPEVIVLVESKNDMRMGATYVTLMKFLVSSTDGFVGGNLHLQDTWVPHMGKEKRSAFVPGSVSPARQPVDPLRPWQAGIQHHP
ncbi:uncharacterized protein [Physcomitrium patens]|uniref:uncharacterized protein n=1 Tax=Physcomitrium patens TaxID=3218 RepID=UPI003CCC9F08